MSVLLWCGVTGAEAAAPGPFAKVPENGNPGSAAGQLDSAEGVVADRSLPGHIYVLDANNARIDEFTAWGEFVKAWGWKVDKASPEEKLQTCTAISECQAGSKSGGTGQMNFAAAIAVDAAGYVYVIEGTNHRVQKFDPTGGVSEEEAEFVLMFGRDVDKTKVEEGAPEAQRDVCTAASGDVCQAGSEGTGPGWVGASGGIYRRQLAATASAIFFGEGETVQRFSTSGTFEEVIAMPAGKSLEAVASDTAGYLYAAFVGEAQVRKLKPMGPSAEFLAPEFEPERETESPKSLTVDGHGNLYVGERGTGGEPELVQEYDASGDCLTCGSAGEGGKPGFDRSIGSALRSIAASSACEADDAYTVHFGNSPPQSYLRAFGQTPNPALCPPPRRPPTIDAQYASSVIYTEAGLRARINPHFWSGDVGTTTYYLQYATQACFEAGGWEAACVEEQPPPPGAILQGGAVGEDVTSAPIVLAGLVPATTYRYRFVAEARDGEGNPVVAGQPVLGEGGTPGAPGKEGAFRTFARPLPEDCLANEAFRTGVSALLPDCRAYEMVSPLDKEGGDIVVLGELTTALPAVLGQSAIDGGRVAYGSYRSFADADSAPYTTQYVASRTEGTGWDTHPVSPPRGRSIFSVLNGFDDEFRTFSPDLCEGAVQSFAEPPLEAQAPPGVTDLYRWTDEGCGGPSFEALNTTPPPNKQGEEFKVELQGVSADGRTATFVADDVLAPGGTPGAGEEKNFQLYVSRGATERFACVLPGGGDYAGICTAGASPIPGQSGHRKAQVGRALSADGNRVYWTATKGGPGPIYLRENPFGEGSECVEESSPCTVDVSKAVEEEAGSTGSQYWAAAEDGSRALFTTGGMLYEFRLEDHSTHLIAGEVLGLMGASEDASRVYLASEEAKGGANAEGESATAGQRNLYFYESGQFHFIGVLADADLVAPSPISIEPFKRDSRVTGDGLHAAFESYAQLTGYDNADVASGKADAEVFLYDAAANGGAGRLVCASCDPGGGRPVGGPAHEGAFSQQAAGRIPVFENSLYASRVLSEDGKRLYFEALGPLTPSDGNGKKDVYQWEQAGSGGCRESSTGFSPFNGGCVELISSGQSSLDSSFLDASPSGNNVFFTTLVSLVPWDYGLVDVYDARVGGGLPPPPAPGVECEGEACQHPLPAPEFHTPAAATYEGPGNLAPERAKHRCPKGKHRVKGKCRKKRGAEKHHHKGRKRHRRAGR